MDIVVGRPGELGYIEAAAIAIVVVIAGTAAAGAVGKTVGAVGKTVVGIVVAADSLAAGSGSAAGIVAVGTAAAVVDTAVAGTAADIEVAAGIVAGRDTQPDVRQQKGQEEAVATATRY